MLRLNMWICHPLKISKVCFPFKPADVLTFVLMVMLSIFMLVQSLTGRSGQMVIIETPKSRMQYDLSKDRTLEVKGAIGACKIEIQKGRVRIVESACDHKICVKKGWTYRTGDSIVCLPNRVRVLIVGNQRKIDAITE